jgi:hypothetical protein
LDVNRGSKLCQLQGKRYEFTVGGLYREAEVRPSEQARQSLYTEVSRSHSSEEATVMVVERRAESLKLRSFFIRIVKANEKGYETIEKPDESC